MTPEIRTQINLLKNTKEETKIAIMEKGVVVYPSDSFAMYPTRIGQISMTPGDKETLLSDLIEGNVLTSFTIPDGTTRIRPEAFFGQTQLTSVTIPSSVESIGANAFNGTGLTSVTIPSGAALDQWVFMNCLSLTSATFASGSKSGYGTFLGCTSLVNVTLPSDSTFIGDRLFNGCTSLTSVAIPDTVTLIGDAAFYGCTSLADITIPANVEEIGGSAFNNCSNLASITCLAEIPPVIDSYYVPFENTNNCPIYVPLTSVDAYKTAWPTYASRIQGYSPNALFNSIVDRSVTSLDIPEGVQKIRHDAFYGCSSLATVTIPSTVAEIGSSAFSGCTSLTTVTCLATTPPTFSGGFGSQVLTAIYVPAASVSEYQSASGWSYYSSIIQAIP